MGFKRIPNSSPRKSVLRLAPVSAVQIVPYTPIQKKENYDLRLLEPHTCVLTEYERRDAGFLAVGSFLSGYNSTGILFRETQPVVMTFRPNGGPKTMQIYLVPREESDGPLPTPSDDDVELAIAGGELIATMQFEGNATKEACEKTRNKLLECLQQGEWWKTTFLSFYA